jgi:hypothetical protein
MQRRALGNAGQSRGQARVPKGQVLATLLVAKEREEEQHQQRHELHEVAETRPLRVLPLLLPPLLLPPLLLPLTIHVSEATVPPCAARLHAEKHVEDVLRVDLLSVHIAASPLSLLHLWALRPETIIVLPLLLVAQAGVRRPNRCELRARMQNTGLLMRRKESDPPTILCLCDPNISTRTRWITTAL